MADQESKDAIQASSVEERQDDSLSLPLLFATFFKIGLTAFGGFMALISVVQNYAVDRKKLLKHEDMLDGVSLASILPGPVAVNVVAYVGYRSRGPVGALISAVAVILPAFLLLLALSSVYVAYGSIPVVNKLFQGFIPAVTAVIASTAWNMSKKVVKGMPEAVLTLLAACLLLAVGGFLVSVAIIAGAGLSGWLLFRTPKSPNLENRREDCKACRRPARLQSIIVPFSAAGVLGLPAAVKLLVVFGGMSVLLFGGGYVFVPLMQRVVVDGFGWVTRQEFMDAIALGQITPGPILISAAFIGYKVAGVAGACTATAGIFTPPAVLMVVCTRFLDRIKGSAWVHACLRGIRPAVVGMIAAAAVIMARTAPLNGVTLLIFLVSLAALVRFNVETAWVIPAAGVCGLFLY